MFLFFFILQFALVKRFCYQRLFIFDWQFDSIRLNNRMQKCGINMFNVELNTFTFHIHFYEKVWNE